MLSHRGPAASRHCCWCTLKQTTWQQSGDGMQMRRNVGLRWCGDVIFYILSWVWWHVDSWGSDPSHVSKIYTELSSVAIVLLLISSAIRLALTQHFSQSEVSIEVTWSLWTNQRPPSGSHSLNISSFPANSFTRSLSGFYGPGLRLSDSPQHLALLRKQGWIFFLRIEWL